jgi:hypothetical protein
MASRNYRQKEELGKLGRAEGVPAFPRRRLFYHRKGEGRSSKKGGYSPAANSNIYLLSHLAELKPNLARPYN